MAVRLVARASRVARASVQNAPPVIYFPFRREKSLFLARVNGATEGATDHNLCIIRLSAS